MLPLDGTTPAPEANGARYRSSDRATLHPLARALLAMSVEQNAIRKLLHRATSSWRNRDAPSIPGRHRCECR